MHSIMSFQKSRDVETLMTGIYESSSDSGKNRHSDNIENKEKKLLRMWIFCLLLFYPVHLTMESIYHYGIDVSETMGHVIKDYFICFYWALIFLLMYHFNRVYTLMRDYYNFNFLKIKKSLLLFYCILNFMLVTNIVYSFQRAKLYMPVGMTKL